jgi:catechol 2,3-dioxygenase-like lactoylglutathione lyase family enzyme
MAAGGIRPGRCRLRGRDLAGRELAPAAGRWSVRERDQPLRDEHDHGRFAGVPVSDLDVSIDWYARFFGRPPARRVADEVLWEIDEHATLFIEPNAAQAGAGRVTLAVTGLDVLLERLAAQRIEREPIETYSNGVRHFNVLDPDRNSIAFAEPPDTASASPRSPERTAVTEEV